MSDQPGNGTPPSTAASGQTHTSAGDARNARNQNDPLIGQVLDGRYRVERVLGEGGMGIVYKAVHTTLGKPLAIKVLRPEVSKNDEIVARFRQEAQSASAIGNQHIIDISDFGTLSDGSTYFVMEFLGGRSLTDAISNEKFTPERTIRVMRQLASALGAAHEVGIVHRDMKPDNVQLVERGNEKDFVKVLDFGIAKVGGSTSKLTQAGQVFGTPHYMSPEQCAGTNVDQRTDIYAVGVILYEMVCGKVPFDADNLMGILTKHLYENPIPPHELPPPIDVPPALEAIIMMCLQKKAELRYQSMSELAADLESIERGATPRAVMDRVDRQTGSGASHTGVEGRMSVGMGQPDLSIRKSRTPMFIGVGVAVAAVIGAVAMFSGKSADGDAANVVKPAAAAAEKPVEPAPAAAPTPAPAPEPAKVTITADPPSAEIYVDGALVGNAPYTLVKPEAGKQVQIEARAAGYDNKSVAVSAATSDSLTLTLVKTAAAAPVVAAPKPSSSHSSRPKPAKGEAPAKEKGPAPAKGRGVQTEVLDPWD